MATEWTFEKAMTRLEQIMASATVFLNPSAGGR